MSCACTSRSNNAVKAALATRRVVAGASRKRNPFGNFLACMQSRCEVRPLDPAWASTAEHATPLSASCPRATEDQVRSADLHAKLAVAVSANWNGQVACCHAGRGRQVQEPGPRG